MCTITNFFLNNAWLNIIFLILAIVSIVLARFYYFKSKKEKKPLYNLKTLTILFTNPKIKNNLEIKYKGRLIQQLMLTQFAFWNAGKSAIRREDIPTSQPFLIRTASDVTIYEFEIIDQNNANNFSVFQVDDKTLQVEFDFVDFNQGIILNIIHSNVPENGFNISGTFIESTPLSYGVRTDEFLEKSDLLTRPFNYLAQHKNFFMKCLAILVFVPTVVIVLPLVAFIYPINAYLNIKYHHFDKKFLLGK